MKRSAANIPSVIMNRKNNPNIIWNHCCPAR
jgi:hypothetical protein